jgi:sulfite reductase (ferredoxin)
MLSAAKAFLLTQDIACNSHHGIISDFDKKIVQTGLISLPTDFRTFVNQINAHEPSEAFAAKYLEDARTFYQSISAKRQKLQEQEINVA